MDAKAYEQFRKLEENHFWFRGRRTIFFDLIGRTKAANGNGAATRKLEILEIGCGEGGMLGPLAEFGNVTGMDISHDSMTFCRGRGHDRVLVGNGYQLPFADDTFDMVALFDVIEHIPDDEQVLREVRRVLRPSGQVFISVPAYQFLYCQNDRVAHHLRRYTRGRLKKVLQTAGLEPRKLTYFNTFLFPLILPAVLWLKLKDRLIGLPDDQTNLSHEIPRPVNETFARLMGSERFLLRHMEFPFGHSLIAMAEA